MSDQFTHRKDLTFAQAEGVEPLPAQLALREVSKEFSAAIWYVLHTSMSACVDPFGGRLGDPWLSILTARHCLVDHLPIDEFDSRFGVIIVRLKKVVFSTNYVTVFGFVQDMLRSEKLPFDVRDGLTTAFEYARSAYRVIDDTVVPIASEAEGKALTRAFADLNTEGYAGARIHLKRAAENLNDARWADSIRESIHAVESVSRSIEPSAGLGKALAKLEKRKKIHAGLKAGFGSIYGFTSDEQGIRHPLVDDDAAAVDEADALFMIGACASFVTYLIGKAQAADLVID